jgi:hypothetical protein
MTSNGYNFSSDGTCNFSGPGDLNNTDPKLGPLQNNGGPTKTLALPPGSPAIDAGNPSVINPSAPTPATTKSTRSPSASFANVCWAVRTDKTLGSLARTWASCWKVSDPLGNDHHRPRR